MVGIARFELVLWGLSLLFQVTLVTYLFATRKWRHYPGLSFYLLVNVLQSVFLYYCYARWGFLSIPAKRAAWASQIPVLGMRAWAVLDLSRVLLKPYSGIWGLAWRILALLGSALVLGSLLTAGRGWQQIVPNLNVSLEWTTVCMIVALFVFARNYEIEPSLAIRWLALGFLLYSSFAILNHTVLRYWLARYWVAWNVFGTLSFLASVCLWWSAAFQPVEELQRASMLPRDIYHVLTPEINLRLRSLNERLLRLFNAEAKQP